MIRRLPFMIVAVLAGAIFCVSAFGAAGKPVKGMCSKGDCKNGKGTMKFDNGNVYEGSWKNGVAEGKGTLTLAQGRIFKGNFENGVLKKGEMIISKKMKYKGDFNAMLQPHGKGKADYGDGSQYSGDFMNGYPEGTGTFSFSNGDKYEGQFKGGKFNGKGVYKTKKEGKVLDCTWVNGKCEGKGTMTAKGGIKYEGSFKDHKYHGQGVLTVKNDKFECEFRDNRPNGKGTHYRGDGMKYVGGFKDGGYDGQGILYDFTGNVVHKGLFKNGQFQGK